MNTKPKCGVCGKSTGTLRRYILADDLENPQLYHKKCITRNILVSADIELAADNGKIN